MVDAWRSEVQEDAMGNDVIIGHDGKPRCSWAGATDIALGRYHDEDAAGRSVRQAIEVTGLPLRRAHECVRLMQNVGVVNDHIHGAFERPTAARHIANHAAGEDRDRKARIFGSTARTTRFRGVGGRHRWFTTGEVARGNWLRARSIRAHSRSWLPEISRDRGPRSDCAPRHRRRPMGLPGPLAQSASPRREWIREPRAARPRPRL